MSRLSKQLNHLNNTSSHGFHTVGEGSLKELNSYYATDPEPDPMKRTRTQKTGATKIDPPLKVQSNVIPVSKPRIDTDSVVRTDKKQSRRIPSTTTGYY